MRVVTLVDILLFDLLPFSPDAVLLHLQTEPSTREGQTLSVLANYVSDDHHAFLFLSALPVLIVPPGVFFLVSAQLRLQVAAWWWPQ
jgi:hypothetical protein